MKLLIIILLGAFALTGCGDSNEASEENMDQEGESQVDENSVAEETSADESTQSTDSSSVAEEVDASEASVTEVADSSPGDENQIDQQSTQGSQIQPSVECIGENNQSIAFTLETKPSSCFVTGYQNGNIVVSYHNRSLDCPSIKDKILNNEVIQNTSFGATFDGHTSMSCSE